MHSNPDAARIFLPVVLLLVTASFGGVLFQRLRMPKVIGEIVGGILLGPTLLGRYDPDLYRELFLNNESFMVTFYLLGLVLLMFASGFEIDPGIAKDDRRTILTITVTSTVVPILFGWGATYFFDLTNLMGDARHLLALRIVIAIAIAITSIPVISKIFFDLNIIQTRFAKVVLSIATLHDIILWVLLSIAAGLVGSRGVSGMTISVQAGVTILVFGLILILVPIVLRFLQRHQVNLIPDQFASSFLFLLLLIFVVLANWLQMNIIFGAFLAGVVIGFIKNRHFDDLKAHVKSISFAFFIPVYFAMVGLKLDLVNQFDPYFCGIFLLFTILIQGITVFGTARALNHRWMTSFNLAMAMNARGGPCIVLATVAYDLRIISLSFFTTLIVLAVVTSLIAGAWLRFVVSSGIPLYDDDTKQASKRFSRQQFHDA